MDQQKLQLKNFPILLPKPTVQLGKIFSQLQLFSKQRLDTNDSNQQGLQNQTEIKGLKFISAKLAKLFFKNRKLPYNQISKILIDNFASQQKDQRNIKRRVYDAINVLVAAGVLLKKNNSIEMIKNKIRPKAETDKKQKMQEQISQKQAVIQQKTRQLKQLVLKRKLIKKLFNRNMKINQQNQKQKHFQNKESVHKASLKKSLKNEFEMDKEQRKFSENEINSLQIINDPHVFIVVKTESLSQKHKGKNKVLKNFRNNDKIEIVVPHQNQKIKQFRNQSHFQLNENKIELESIQQDKIEVQIEKISSDFTPSKQIYSFIDIISLLIGSQFHEN